MQDDYEIVDVEEHWVRKYTEGEQEEDQFRPLKDGEIRTIEIVDTDGVYDLYRVTYKRPKTPTIIPPIDPPIGPPTGPKPPKKRFRDWLKNRRKRIPGIVPPEGDPEKEPRDEIPESINIFDDPDPIIPDPKIPGPKIGDDELPPIIPGGKIPDDHDPEPTPPEDDKIIPDDRDPEPTPPGEEPTKDEDEKVLMGRVTEHHSSNIPGLLAIPAAALIIAGFFPKEETEVKVEGGAKLPDKVYHEEIETPNHMVGSTIRLENGMEFMEMSDGRGAHKTLGNEFNAENKFAGDYRVTGLSLFDENGVFLEAIEDFDAIQTGPDLESFIMGVAEKHGIDPRTIKPAVHFGTNKDNSRLGWINVDNPIQDPKEVVIEGPAFSFTSSDEKGEMVTLENGVEIKVVDQNGDLLPAGSKVVGSDGLEYEITNIYKEENKTRGHVSIPILALGGGVMLAGAVAYFITKNKNRKAEKNPEFYEFETEEEYQAFLNKFRENLEEYNKKSAFRLITTVQYYKDLTPEQRKEIRKVIEQFNGVKYNYDPSRDRIEFLGKKIIIRYANGYHLDITDIVKDQIADIGRENAVVEEGLTDDELARRSKS